MNKDYTILQRFAVILLCSISIQTDLLRAQDFFRERVTYHTYDQLLISASSTLADGLFIAAGSVIDGATNAFVVKVDTTGQVLWSERLKADTRLSIESMAALTDGSVIIAGTSYQFENPSSERPILMCMESDGKIRWCKQYNIGAGASAQGSVLQLSDGGFTLCGNIFDAVDPNNSTGFILKTDSSGMLQWVKGVPADSITHTLFYDVAEDRATHTISILGHASPNGNMPINALTLTRFSFSGDLIDQHSFLVDEELALARIVSTGGSGFIVGGSFRKEFSGQLPFLIAFDTSYHPVWAKTYSFFSDDELSKLIELPNNNIVALTIEQVPPLGAHHVFLLDSEGNMLAASGFEGGAVYETAISPYATSSGSFIVFQSEYGYADNNHFQYSTIGSRLEGCQDSQELGISTPVTLRDTTVHSPLTDLTITQSDLQITIFNDTSWTDILCTTSSVPSQSQRTTPATIAISPNPVASNAMITVSFSDVPGSVYSVYDVVVFNEVGTELYRTNGSSSGKLQVPTGGLPGGIYTIAIVDSDSQTYRASSKVVVQ